MDINQREEIKQLFKSMVEEEKQENNFRKEFEELKEATTDTCYQCGKLVAKNANHCDHCNAEFEAD